MNKLQPMPAHGLTLVALFATTLAQASELAGTAAPNADMRYIAASMQRDAKDDQAAIGLLSLPVGDRWWAQFGGGQTRSEHEADARRASVLNAGFGYIGNGWLASLAASRRTAGSSLRQTDWNGVLEWRGEQFDVGVDGHYRDARLRGTVATPTLPSGTTDVTVFQRVNGGGIGVHGTIRVTESFSVYAAAMRFDYRVSTQQTGGGAGGSQSLLSRVLLQPSPSPVSREEAALSRSSKLGASYRFEKMTLSGDVLADRVLDEPGTVRTMQLKAALALTPQWTATPSVGRTESETHGGVNFGGLALSCAW
jgi:hypothetical protein